MADRKIIEQKTLELGALDSRLKELEQALGLLEGQISEFQLCQFSLDEIGDLKKGSETMMPLGAGIFIKGNITNTGEVLIDVGARVLCKKTVHEAREMIEKKLNHAIDLRSRIINEVQNLVQNIIQQEQQIKKLAGE
jgi:prefoldin alpha subunit